MRKIDRRGFLALSGIGFSLAALGSEAECKALFSTRIPAEQRSGPWLEISLENLAWNLGQIRRVVQGRPVMAVIKNNAYGLGLLGVAKLLQRENIEYLAVAGATSAFMLREGGIKNPILNLGPFSRAEAIELASLNITQSVYTDEFAELAEAADRLGAPVKIHIKIDTGLGRLGVPYYRALPLIKKIASTKGVAIEGVFTSFTEDEEFDRDQLGRFLEVCGAAKNEGIDLGLRHAASSAAVLAFPESHLDMVRPGITVYGHYPSAKAREEQRIDLKPALQLKAPVLYVKNLRPGDGVSYHRPFVAEKETTVATIGLGYADGYPREVVNKGEVLIGGKRYPLIAAITANHMSADLGIETGIGIGDEAVLIGTQGQGEITVEEVAECAGISEYKLLAQMSPLLPRRFL